jgi:hypothetical protein
MELDPELGGVLVAKDFTTVLNEHGSTRNRLFAILREVYDGRLTRHLGTRGGRPFEWSGKASFAGAVTDAIDTIDPSLMGERFLYYRLPPFGPSDDYLVAMVANENANRKREIRREWQKQVTRFISNLKIPHELPPLSESEEERLITLATVGARCRSTVVRDGYHQDVIELVPSHERSPRLFGELRQLHAGLVVLGATQTDIWRLLPQVALDGIHRDRRRVLEVAAETSNGHTTATVGGRVGLPFTSVRRHLEDLWALGAINKVAQSGPETWVASDWLREQWWAVYDSWESSG